MGFRCARPGLGERGRADGTPHIGLHAAWRVAGPGRWFREVAELGASSILSAASFPIVSSPQDTPTDRVQRHLLEIALLVHVDQRAIFERLVHVDQRTLFQRATTCGP